MSCSGRPPSYLALVSVLLRQSRLMCWYLPCSPWCGWSSAIHLDKSPPATRWESPFLSCSCNSCTGQTSAPFGRMYCTENAYCTRILSFCLSVLLSQCCHLLLAHRWSVCGAKTQYKICQLVECKGLFQQILCPLQQMRGRRQTHNHLVWWVSEWIEMWVGGSHVVLEKEKCGGWVCGCMFWRKRIKGETTQLLPHTTETSKLHYKVLIEVL